MVDSGRAFWDGQAATFDDVADHGLTDRRVREAWRSLLMPLLRPPPARVADIGCGTGSISSLLAAQGYDVVGIDFSAQMLERARTKVASDRLALVQADAGAPPLRTGSVEVVIARHVLWAMEGAGAAVQRWLGLLRSGGVAVLVEGAWWTGVGLRAQDLAPLVRRYRQHVETIRLDDPTLWGRAVDDERYVIVSRS
jgi:SAM-dependent methyltransferase